MRVCYLSAMILVLKIVGLLADCPEPKRGTPDPETCTECQCSVSTQKSKRTHCPFTKIGNETKKEACIRENCCWQVRRRTPNCYQPRPDPPGKNPDRCPVFVPSADRIRKGWKNINRNDCECIGGCYDNSIQGALFCFQAPECPEPDRGIRDPITCRDCQCAIKPKAKRRLKCEFTQNVNETKANACMRSGCCYEEVKDVPHCYQPLNATDIAVEATTCAIPVAFEDRTAMGWRGIRRNDCLCLGACYEDSVFDEIHCYPPPLDCPEPDRGALDPYTCRDCQCAIKPKAKRRIKCEFTQNVNETKADACMRSGCCYQEVKDVPHCYQPLNSTDIPEPATTCDTWVPFNERIAMGWIGIKRNDCLCLGACYEDSVFNEIHCYQPPTPVP